MSYDLVQKYGDRVHHGFQSLAREYWELWHGDGFNRETSSSVAKVWQEAKEMGYDAYKKK
jgi:hypothetical protein